jgi:hypothetical protein
LDFNFGLSGGKDIGYECSYQSHINQLSDTKIDVNNHVEKSSFSLFSLISKYHWHEKNT